MPGVVSLFYGKKILKRGAWLKCKLVLLNSTDVKASKMKFHLFSKCERVGNFPGGTVKVSVFVPVPCYACYYGSVVKYNLRSGFVIPLALFFLLKVT